MKRLASLIIAAAAIIFVFAGCNSPTSPTVDEYKGVYGRLAGVVIDKTTGEALEGVTVAITGAGGYSAVTDATGTFLIENVLPGYYAVSYTKEGYKTNYLGAKDYDPTQVDAEPLDPVTDGQNSPDSGAQIPPNPAGTGIGEKGYIYVNAQQYLYDDPFAEWYLLREEIEYFNAQLTEAPEAPKYEGSGWSYVEGNYYYTSDAGIVVTYNTETKGFTFSNTKINLDRAYSYGITLGVQTLTPLSSGATGELYAVFGDQVDNFIIGERLLAPAADGVKVFFVDEAVNPKVVYGPALVSGGIFTLEKGLPADTQLTLQVEGFSQVSDFDGGTYYFNGDRVVFYDGASAPVANNNNQFTTKANQITNFAKVYTFANLDDVFIVSHNIGEASRQNPILVDGEIQLTFSKPIAASSFKAWIERDATGGADTFNDTTATADIGLNATWSSDGKAVVLKAANKPDGTDVRGVSGFPFDNTGTLYIQVGSRAIDGSVIRYNNSAVNTDGALTVHTEPALILLKVEYDTTRGGRAYLESNPVLPAGGAVKLTFSKPISADYAYNQFAFWQAPDDTTAFTAADWKQIAGKPGTSYSNNVVYVWPGDDNLLASARLGLQYKVYSTRPNDFDEIAIGGGAILDEFVSPDSIKLTRVNLYQPNFNIYYQENLSIDPYFPLNGVIELEFDTDLTDTAEKTYLVEAELYDTGVILAKYDDPKWLASVNLATPSTVTKDPANGKIIKIDPVAPFYEDRTYALAVKVIENGRVVFNTKSTVFAYYNAVSGSTAITVQSGLKPLVVMQRSDAPTLATATTANSSPYIVFQTENSTPASFAYIAASSTALAGLKADPANPITLVFEKPIATVHDVKLYFYRDANNDYSAGPPVVPDVVAVNELYPIDDVVVAHEGGAGSNVLTITPAGILANNLNFALKLDLEAADGSRAIYDTFRDPDLLIGDGFNDHLVFTTVTSAPTAFDVANYLTGVAPTIVNFDWDTYQGDKEINTDTTSFYFKWDPINRSALYNDLLLVANQPNYRVYYQAANAIGWQPAGGVANELTYAQLRTPDLPKYATVNVTPTLYGENAFENGNTVNFVVIGHDAKGYVHVSDLLPLTDNVSPVLDPGAITAADRGIVSTPALTFNAQEPGATTAYGVIEVSGTINANTDYTIELTDPDGEAIVVSNLNPAGLPAGTTADLRNNVIRLKVGNTVPDNTNTLSFTVKDTSGNDVRIVYLDTTAAADVTGAKIGTVTLRF